MMMVQVDSEGSEVKTESHHKVVGEPEPNRHHQSGVASVCLLDGGLLFCV